MKSKKQPATAKDPAPGDKKTAKARAPGVKANPAAEPAAPAGKKPVRRAVTGTAVPAKKAAQAVAKPAAPRKAPAKVVTAEAAIPPPAAKKPAARTRVKAQAPSPAVPPPEPDVLAPLELAAANDAVADTATTFVAIAEMVIVVEDESTRRHRIAVEAYLIAESRGFPPGRDDMHWLEAERKLYGK